MSKKEESLLRKSQVETMFPQFSTMTEHDKTTIRKTHYYRQRLTPEPITQEQVSRLTIAQIWELTRASYATIHRWKKHPEKIPYATQQLLKYSIFGIIPQGFGEWGGSHFGKDGRLYPLFSNDGYTENEVYAFWLTIHEAGHVPGLRRRIEALEKELRFHKSQTKENSQLGFMRGMMQVLQET